MTKTRHLVIGDVHGQIDNLRAFLWSQNLINDQGERTDHDTCVVSVGDLIDGSISKQWHDEELLKVAENWIDKYVIGNHEQWFLSPDMMLKGYDLKNPAIRTGLNRLERLGILVPAAVAQGYLVVHGGLAARWNFESAEDACAAITEAYRSPRYQPIIDNVGKHRGGRDSEGGVLWADWREARNPRFGQIVGHTPQDGIKKCEYGTGAVHWNIDVGAKKGKNIGALLIEDGETTPLIYQALGANSE